MGIITTNNDLLKLFNEMNNNKYCNSKNIKRIIKPIGFSNNKIIYPEIDYELYGLGLNISSYRDHLFIYHEGNYPGYSSQITYFPQEQIII